MVSFFVDYLFPDSEKGDNLTGGFPFLRLVIGSSYPCLAKSLLTYLSLTNFLISFKEEFGLGFLNLILILLMNNRI